MNRIHSSVVRSLRNIVAMVANAALIMHFPASAQQFLDGSDSKTKTATISATEMTRIAFENGRIKSIKYDEAELLVNDDNISGQLFVRPLVKDKPISVFVITSTGTTHALELTPGPTGLSSIIIQEPRKNPARTDNPDASLSAPGRGMPERLSVFDSQLRRLLLIMARDEPAVEFEKVPKNRELALWEGTRFFWIDSRVGRGLRGDSYSLVNASERSMRLVEQEFYNTGVVAVSIEVQELPPGATTNVFVVRRELAK